MEMLCAHPSRCCSPRCVAPRVRARRRRPAAPGLLVGMDDDTLKWADKPQAHATLAHARDLGIRAVRVTVPWHPGPDAAQRRRPHPGRPDDPRHLGGALPRRARRVRARRRRAADRRRPRRLLHLRRQPAAPLPRRRRRRDLERGEQRPLLAAAVRRAAATASAPAQYEALLARLLRHPPPRSPERERDRRLLPARQRQPGCCDAVPLARRVLPQARRGLPRERPAGRRSSTRSATTRIRRRTPSGRGRSTAAGRSARATTTS